MSCLGQLPPSNINAVPIQGPGKADKLLCCTMQIPCIISSSNSLWFLPFSDNHSGHAISHDLRLTANGLNTTGHWLFQLLKSYCYSFALWEEVQAWVKECWSGINNSPWRIELGLCYTKWNLTITWFHLWLLCLLTWLKSSKPTPNRQVFYWSKWEANKLNMQCQDSGKPGTGKCENFLGEWGGGDVHAVEHVYIDWLHKYSYLYTCIYVYTYIPLSSVHFFFH